MQPRPNRRWLIRASLIAVALVFVLIAWPRENPKLTPETDEAVAELRALSAQRVVVALDDFAHISSFNAASVQSTDEYCNEGEDNWKRKDPYKEQCALSVTRYFGFSGDFEEAVLDLHAALRQGGWEDPWLHRVGWEDPPYNDSHISQFLGYFHPGRERNGRTFDVSMMPGLTDAYEVDGMRVEIRFAERSSPLERDPFGSVATLGVSGAIVTEYYRTTNIVDYVIPIRELGETDTYFVAVKLSETYYS